MSKCSETHQVVIVTMLSKLKISGYAVLIWHITTQYSCTGKSQDTRLLWFIFGVQHLLFLSWQTLWSQPCAIIHNLLLSRLWARHVLVFYKTFNCSSPLPHLKNWNESWWVSLAQMESSLGVPAPGANLSASFKDGVLKCNSLQVRQLSLVLLCC